MKEKQLKNLEEETSAKKKDSGFSITIATDAIKGVEITKYGEYHYARVGAKIDEDTYVNVSYEWKGDAIPDGVMALMSFVQANKDVIEEDEELYKEVSSRIYK